MQEAKGRPLLQMRAWKCSQRGLTPSLALRTWSSPQSTPCWGVWPPPASGDAVQQYVAKAAQKSDLERTELQKVKTGVDTGTLPGTFCSTQWLHMLNSATQGLLSHILHQPGKQLLVLHPAMLVKSCASLGKAGCHKGLSLVP